MKRIGKGIAKLILIIGLVLLVAYNGKVSAPDIKLGLDLAGGVSITYQASKENGELTSEDMGDSVYKLQLKAHDYTTEAEVYQEGNDKINIDIPGVSDKEGVLEELGKPGSLYFFARQDLSWPLLSTNSDALKTDNDAVDGAIREGETQPEDLVNGPGVTNESVTRYDSIVGDNANDSSVADTISETVAGHTNTETVSNNVLGENVNIEGANAYQNPDGSIQIGGTPQEGATLINQGAPTTSTSSDADFLGYDTSKPPIFDSEKALLSGNDVASARGGIISDSLGQTQYVVDLTFTEEGKTKFAQATETYYQQPIYIIYNGEIQSAPVVQAVITDGKAQITGMESLEAAERLASTIRIGALNVTLNVIRSNEVGAKLGQDAISTSVKAGLIGFAIICLFMIIIYRLPGFAASLALTMYVGLTLFLIKEFGITLTLPGIAGIILSIGMAVDANVIIFTRIKEEIGAGKNTRTAVREGYNKALSAIIDGNITTLIAAAVLNYRGTGSIKGFAATLALGIVLSMVTALFITKFIMNAFLDLGLDNEMLYGKKKDKTIINFVGFRRISYLISLVLIVIGVSFIAMNAAKGIGGFNYGLDFTGGSSTSIDFNEELSLDRVDKEVIPIFQSTLNTSDIQQQRVTGTNQVIIKTRTIDDTTEMPVIKEELKSKFGIEDSAIQNTNIYGVVSSQMRQDAIVAVIIATILMLIYIWFRFKDIKFAGSAVLALVHDCLVTVGFYAVFRWTVDSTFIACMLTIVGYSINATIVIFDRIRENLGRLRGTSVENIVNASVTQTFTRSINTSLTTLIMVVTLYIMGVSSIKAFALPLIIGIVCGGYSSICLTGPLWFDFKKTKNSIEAKKLAAENVKKK